MGPPPLVHAFLTRYTHDLCNASNGRERERENPRRASSLVLLVFLVLETVSRLNRGSIVRCTHTTRWIPTSFFLLSRWCKFDEGEKNCFLSFRGLISIGGSEIFLFIMKWNVEDKNRGKKSLRKRENIGIKIKRTRKVSNDVESHFPFSVLYHSSITFPLWIVSIYYIKGHKRWKLANRMPGG